MRIIEVHEERVYKSVKQAARERSIPYHQLQSAVANKKECYGGLFMPLGEYRQYSMRGWRQHPENNDLYYTFLTKQDVVMLEVFGLKPLDPPPPLPEATPPQTEEIVLQPEEIAPQHEEIVSQAEEIYVKRGVPMPPTTRTNGDNLWLSAPHFA